MMKNLSEITDKNPFRVPENYFEEVNRKIISATSDNLHKARKIKPYARLRPYLTIAAGIAGFIILSFITVRLVTTERASTRLSQVMIEENSENVANDIDLFTLEENAASLDLSEWDPDVTSKDIIDCLLFENIEISDIYEQL